MLFLFLCSAVVLLLVLLQLLKVNSVPDSDELTWTILMEVFFATSIFSFKRKFIKAVFYVGCFSSLNNLFLKTSIVTLESSLRFGSKTIAPRTMASRTIAPQDNCPQDNCPPEKLPPDNPPLDNCPPDNYSRVVTFHVIAPQTIAPS